MFVRYNLSGDCQSELNTEMRYLLADAKVSGMELVRFDFLERDSEKENSRVMSCIIKTLRTIKRESAIQFYVNSEGFSVNSTEAVFLLNKYGKHLSDVYKKSNYVFVKL